MHFEMFTETAAEKDDATKPQGQLNKCLFSRGCTEFTSPAKLVVLVRLNTHSGDKPVNLKEYCDRLTKEQSRLSLARRPSAGEPLTSTPLSLVPEYQNLHFSFLSLSSFCFVFLLFFFLRCSRFMFFELLCCVAVGFVLVLSCLYVAFCVFEFSFRCFFGVFCGLLRKLCSESGV